MANRASPRPEVQGSINLTNRLPRSMVSCFWAQEPAKVPPVGSSRPTGHPAAENSQLAEPQPQPLMPPPSSLPHPSPLQPSYGKCKNFKEDSPIGLCGVNNIRCRFINSSNHRKKLEWIGRRLEKQKIASTSFLCFATTCERYLIFITHLKGIEASSRRTLVTIRVANGQGRLNLTSRFPRSLPACFWPQGSAEVPPLGASQPSSPLPHSLPPFLLPPFLPSPQEPIYGECRNFIVQSPSSKYGCQRYRPIIEICLCNFSFLSMKSSSHLKLKNLEWKGRRLRKQCIGMVLKRLEKQVGIRASPCQTYVFVRVENGHSRLNLTNRLPKRLASCFLVQRSAEVPPVGASQSSLQPPPPPQKLIYGKCQKFIERSPTGCCGCQRYHPLVDVCQCCCPLSFHEIINSSEVEESRMHIEEADEATDGKEIEKPLDSKDAEKALDRNQDGESSGD